MVAVMDVPQATTATANRVRNGGPRIHNKAGSSGPIEPGKLYSLDDALSRLRWSQWAFRTARRNGLKVIRTGGHAYLRGDDILEYFNKLAAAE